NDETKQTNTFRGVVLVLEQSNGLLSSSPLLSFSNTIPSLTSSLLLQHNLLSFSNTIPSLTSSLLLQHNPLSFSNTISSPPPLSFSNTISSPLLLFVCPSPSVLRESSKLAVAVETK